MWHVAHRDDAAGVRDDERGVEEHREQACSAQVNVCAQKCQAHCSRGRASARLGAPALLVMARTDGSDTSSRSIWDEEKSRNGSGKQNGEHARQGEGGSRGSSNQRAPESSGPAVARRCWRACFTWGAETLVRLCCFARDLVPQCTETAPSSRAWRFPPTDPVRWHGTCCRQRLIAPDERCSACAASPTRPPHARRQLTVFSQRKSQDSSRSAAACSPHICVQRRNALRQRGTYARCTPAHRTHAHGMCIPGNISETDNGIPRSLAVGVPQTSCSGCGADALRSIAPEQTPKIWGCSMKMGCTNVVW